MKGYYSFPGERTIYESGKPARRYIVPAALAALTGLLVKMKHSKEGIAFKFLPIDSYDTYIMVYYGEWALVAVLALMGVVWLAKLLQFSYVITDRRLYEMYSQKKGRYIDISQIRYADFARATLRSGQCGKKDIVIDTPKGAHLMKDIANPKAFLESLREAHVALCGTEPERTKLPEGDTSESKGKGVPAENPDMGDPMEKLDSLIGLASVKAEVRSLRNFVTVQRMREEAGQARADLNLHTIFTGNPGTGKTTVARIIAQVYRQAGILSTGQLVETDRSGLVADYVGQTAGKTNAVIDRAIGGVLFIDEAYSLTEGGPNDFGREAVTTLLKRMEDDRGKFVVILAGYTDRMERFLESNPGLRSRFPKVIPFPDYGAEELLNIFLLMVCDNGYEITDEGKEEAARRFREAVAAKGRNFGNARFARNLFERTIQNQADRIMGSIYGSEETSLIINKDIA